MPPKKNTNNSPMKEKKKVVRQRAAKVKVEKPKLKAPSTLKLKIPVQNIAQPTVDEVSLKKYGRKNIPPNIKVDLANEVLHHVFSKNQTVKDDPAEHSKVTPKKKGRQKKIMELFDKNNESPEPVKKPKGRGKTCSNETPKTAKSVTATGNDSIKEATKRKADPSFSQPTARAKVSKTTRSLPRVAKKPIKLIRTRSKAASETKSKCESNAVGKKAECPKSSAGINSHRSSVNSNSSLLSWTKDISSSSSTTTCLTVTSNDFVRFDKKIPRIAVHKIKTLRPSPPKTILESSESSSDAESDTPEGDVDISGLENRSLQLSSSSVTSLNKSPVRDDPLVKISNTLDRLKSTLKDFDLEIVNWIGYRNEDPPPQVELHTDKVFRVLKSEHDVLFHCQQLKNIILGSDNSEPPRATPVVPPIAPPEESKEPLEPDIDFAVPPKVDSHQKGRRAASVFKPRDPPDDLRPRTPESDDNFTSDRFQYVAFSDGDDDDDALSLFAESITGLESRRSSVVPSVDEEYVPEPLPAPPRPPYSYRPTRIELPACATADSTKPEAPPPEPARGARPSRWDPPARGVAARSQLFRAVCFYNLISNCKKSNCAFPHVEPTAPEVSAGLARLPPPAVMQEYQLVMGYPSLRQRYAPCFAELAARTGLTRFLLEMAADFVVRGNPRSKEQSTACIDVLEQALMHLNTADLRLCADVLVKEVSPARQLCDALMETLAATQNFSRFRSAFAKLTRFAVEVGRRFAAPVAEQILERVCILPADAALARCVVDICRRSDARVFRNSMAPRFEKVLRSLPGSAAEDWLQAKEGAEPAPRERYTSPDTTHLDVAIKPPIEPIITRTIDFSRLRQVNHFKPNRSPNKVPLTLKWRNKKVFDNIKKKYSLDGLRQVTYGLPEEFPRGPANDFC